MKVLSTLSTIDELYEKEKKMDIVLNNVENWPNTRRIEPCSSVTKTALAIKV